MLKLSIYIFNPIYALPTISYKFIGLIICLSIITLIIGSIGGLYQTKIKRLMAYSAITNVGYLLLTLSTQSFMGYFTFFIFFITYIIMTINFFLIFLVLKKKNSNLKLKNIVELINVPHSNFVLSVLLALSFFSLAGIPPFAGFFGKLFVFITLIDKGWYFLALYSLLISVLTCVYYIS